jgi:hypothetical protein
MESRVFTFLTVTNGPKCHDWIWTGSGDERLVIEGQRAWHLPRRPPEAVLDRDKCDKPRTQPNHKETKRKGNQEERRPRGKETKRKGDQEERRPGGKETRRVYHPDKN